MCGECGREPDSIQQLKTSLTGILFTLQMCIDSQPPPTEGLGSVCGTSLPSKEMLFVTQENRSFRWRINVKITGLVSCHSAPERLQIRGDGETGEQPSDRQRYKEGLFLAKRPVIQHGSQIRRGM